MIVVGSGPSGLTAAFELKRAGHRVRLLEARAEVGGKMRSGERDGFVLDRGAFFLPTTHRTLLGVAEAAGFADRLRPGGFVLATERDGAIHELDGDHLARDFLRTPLLSRRAKLGAARLVPELVRSRRATFDRMPETAPYDTETVERWARRTLAPELAEYLLCTTMRSMFNASHEALPRVDFLAIVRLFAGAELVAFPQGMGYFSDTVAALVEAEVRARVLGVEETADGVEVTWRDGDGSERTETAAGCVLAVPAAEALVMHPALDDWRRGYMGRVRRGKSFCVNVALPRPPKEIEAVYVQVPPSTHPFLVGIGFDHNKAPGRVPDGKGMLTLATMSEWCDDNADADDETIASALLRALEQVLPGVAEPEFCEVNRWEQEYNPVGHYRGLARFRSLCETGDGRVQLAGDYHSSQSLNSAATAGQLAARRLHRSLSSG